MLFKAEMVRDQDMDRSGKTSLTLESLHMWRPQTEPPEDTASLAN